MSRIHRPLRIGIAGVWIVFGLLFKLLDGVPRHREIVARILGQDVAPLTTLLIGGGEVLLGLWVLSGRYPSACAAVQTGVLITMNTLELRLARDLLLAPWTMVLANVLFLSLGWYLALAKDA